MKSEASDRGVRPRILAVIVAASCSFPPAAPSMAVGDEGASTSTSKPGVRTPWTTSRLTGSPDPAPPYRVEPAFPALRFEKPVVITAAKGLDRLFVAELGGKVYSFPNRSDCDRADLAIDLEAAIPEASNIFGMAFHPDFARNRRVYLCYTVKRGGPEGTRISSFRVEGTSPPRINKESEALLLTWQAGGHNAGCLAFGPDGCLYIATGDTADPTPPDPLGTGQLISDLPSSILRVDVDRRGPGKPYDVPADNPFVGVAGARPEVWAFGFRNPWRMSFDRKTGDLWAGDVGWELWEMIHLVKRGGNYGWSIMEGPQQVHPGGHRGPGPILPPVVAHPHSEAGSITGGYVYRGRKLPALAGVYIYGDFQSGKVWGLRHDGKQVVWGGELADTPLQLVSFGEDNEGEVYALDFERSKLVYKFVPNGGGDDARSFPRTLGQTGLFASTASHTPAPGVVPYAINAELWSDHAEAERLLAVPGSGRVVVDASGRWKVPEGTVLARTISLEFERGNPRSRRRLETQILHHEGGSWRPYTYLWDDKQADATLVDAKGSGRTLRIKDARAPGGERFQDYRAYARSECLLCHNPWVERQTTMFGRQTASPLAFHTAQLNRTAGADRSPRDQLRVLREIGLLEGLPSEDLGTLPRLVSPYDRKAGLEARVRSYLGVNCAHCHQFGAGGSANIDLQASATLAGTKAVGVPPIQGSFGITDARIIAPGDPEGSILYYRMAKLGGGRMPRLGSDVVDEVGLKLIHDWIAGLARPSGTAGRPEGKADQAALGRLHVGSGSSAGSRTEAIRRLIDSPRGGLALMHGIDRGQVDRSVVREVLSAINEAPRAEVKDLFERFIPPADRVRRLGDSIDPNEILTLKGDSGRGEKLFFAATTLCSSCHRVAKNGVGLGPDLDAIGSKYDRPTLLRHILEPSLAIDPKYIGQILETRSGAVHAGILVEKTAREVVLKDAKNETIRIPAEDVETLAPQSRSPMPESLLRDLTAQQAADLLGYLGSLKGP